MKSLLLKDFYMAKKYCRTLLAFSLLFSLLGFWSDNAMLRLMPGLYAGMTPMTLLIYDEREHWLTYAETLPYTRGQIVTEKYLVGLCAGGPIALLMLLVQTAAMLTQGYFSLEALLGYFTATLLTCFVSSSLVMPFLFKLGAEKGRIAYLITLGLLGALAGAGVLVFPPSAFLPGDYRFSGNLLIPLSLVAFVAALYTLSWRLSLHFYQNREL